MDYNTELQDNNTDLQAILDAVNALPDKIDHGDSCTVTISGRTISRCIYHQVTNAGVVMVDSTPSSTSVTLENVLCDSLVYFETSASSNKSITNGTNVFGGATTEHGVRVTATSGGTVSISLTAA